MARLADLLTFCVTKAENAAEVINRNDDRLQPIATPKSGQSRTRETGTRRQIKLQLLQIRFLAGSDLHRQ
jgi:hypothetical protein